MAAQTHEPRRPSGLQRGVVLAFVALGAPSCFFYDSRWGETKRTQQSVAQHATPGALRATPEAAAPAAAAASKPLRVLKLRVHATPRYASEVLEWPRRLTDLLADANDVLAPTLDMRLEVVSADSWSPHAGEEDLGALVDELAATDPGKDVDRVVALVASVPRYELSFHQLGMGQIMGKHLAVRATNDAREYEAIRRGFSELDEKERTKLYAARKRHKTTTVFLHELGHTLGVPHELDKHTIMHPSYDSKVEGFSPAAADLMRLSLAHEVEPKAESRQAFSRALLDHLQRTSTSWVDADRDALIARLERAASPPPARPAAPAPKATAERPRTGALEPADQAAFEAAQTHLRAGRVAEASSSAAPLFSKYPDDYAVQELRCQLAMKRGGDWQDIQAVCDGLLKLVPGGR